MTIFDYCMEQERIFAREEQETQDTERKASAHNWRKFWNAQAVRSVELGVDKMDWEKPEVKP